MASGKKSWNDKLADDKGLPKVVALRGKAAAKWGAGTMVLPSPREVQALMRRVPEGRVVTIGEIRAALARRHGATMACPLVTGIFAWIAAHAAAEAPGDNPPAYWRTLKTGGELNPKFPGGVRGLAQRLRGEGHRIVKRGRRYYVKDYEEALARL